jgi:AcrR family transcriptional regulator
MGRPKTIETEELLGIAREVFLEGGASGSTKEIARRAGISEAALFKRFPTKTALFLAAMTPPQPDVAQMLEKAQAQKDPRDALHVLAGEMLAYFRMAIPRMLPIITHPAIGLEELLRHFGVSPAEKLTEGVASYLASERERGRIGANNPLAATGLLVATLHSVALFEFMGIHGGAIPDSAVRAMIDTMWQGIAPKSKSPRRKRQ